MGYLHLDAHYKLKKTKTTSPPSKKNQPQNNCVVLIITQKRILKKHSPTRGSKMHTSDQTSRPNPMDGANFLSRGLFCWLNPLFKKGYNRNLEQEDLFNVSSLDRSDTLGTRLEAEWQKQVDGMKEGKEPSLLKALYHVFGLQYLLVGSVVFLEEGTKVIQPLLLGGLIRYFVPDSNMSRKEAWMYAIGVSLCAVMLAVSHHPYFFWVQRIGMRMRVACCSLMYKKCLKLSNKAMGNTTTGQIVNLMSNDVNRFDQAVIFLHFLWVGPLQALLVLFILWRELGPSVVAGFVVLMLLIPLQGFMGRLFSKLRHKTAIHTDERVKVMNEIIAGMRVIKMYCWEKPFGQLVEKIRKREIHSIRQKMRLSSYTCSVWVIVHRFICFVVAATCVVLQNAYNLRPPSLFSAMPLFLLVSHTLAGVLFEGVKAAGECSVTIVRIQRFLLLDEVDTSKSSEKPALRPKTEDCYISLEKVTGKWNENLSQNTLEDITMEVRAGQLVSVIGPVGCGKSSLLMAILGELQSHKGDIKVAGHIAYVSQQPWIFSGSVRQNILFGAEYNTSRYNKVIYVSALRRDFEIMPFGDGTLIGDRGVSLSGGQKARISLARALYMDADIYLMDDPLSAVDAAVARHIFERCIVQYLQNKPRILITHQVQFLPDADTIYILKEGKISGHGTFSELSQSGVDFSELLQEEEEEESLQSPSINKATSCDAILNITAQVNKFGSMISLGSMAEDYQPEAVTLPEEEERASGTVGLGVYVDYFKAGTGLLKFLLLILLNLLAQVFYVGSDWWLSQWSNQEEERYAARLEYFDFLNTQNISAIQASNMSSYNITPPTIPIVDRDKNISIFAGIVFAVFVFGLGRALLFFKICVDASQALHNRMFARILRSPVSFFDTNPVGRVLNRFSKDIGHMDDLLPVCFFDFMQCFLLIIGIILVAGIVNPYVFIPTVPLAVLFIIIRMYYLRTSRSIKRLEGTLRSPVFSYLSASLQGLATIRSMGMETKCIEEFDNFQDGHTEAWFLFLATSRWLAVRLDWLCVLFVTAVTFCALLASDTMSAGMAGLSITYSMTLMGMFQWGVRQSAEVENQMISVERVLEYSRLPEEAELESDRKKKPPSSWPIEGAIEADSVYLQYSPSGPYVLKGLSFEIKGMEKVGIVGRTGAGKSSLITALFRMSEPEGTVMIDGLNTKDIGLHDLRKKISIIPQDPFLFTGTLRKNLDPFLDHQDESLWRALDEVKLKEQIQDLPHDLNTEVSEGGTNFSVGQRQLICLARAVLRNNKILLIDEATANVDPNTDELIQATIRTKFHACTVLTIAHRLHTIMDSDRVMVLDDGKIMEFTTPYDLLSQGHGHLYDMAQQTGKAEFDRLLEIAKEAALNRSKNLTELSTLPNGNSRSKGKEDSTLQEVSFASSSKSSSDQELQTYSLDDIIVSLSNLRKTNGQVEDEEEEEKEEEVDEGSLLRGKERVKERLSVNKEEEVEEEHEQKLMEEEDDNKVTDLKEGEVLNEGGKSDELVKVEEEENDEDGGRFEDEAEDSSRTLLNSEVELGIDENEALLSEKSIKSNEMLERDDDGEDGNEIEAFRSESSASDSDLKNDKTSDSRRNEEKDRKEVEPSSKALGSSSLDDNGVDALYNGGDEKETLLPHQSGSTVNGAIADTKTGKERYKKKKSDIHHDTSVDGDDDDDDNDGDSFNEGEKLLKPKESNSSVIVIQKDLKNKNDDDDIDV